MLVCFFVFRNKTFLNNFLKLLESVCVPQVRNCLKQIINVKPYVSSYVPSMSMC